MIERVEIDRKCYERGGKRESVMGEMKRKQVKERKLIRDKGREWDERKLMRENRKRENW